MGRQYAGTAGKFDNAQVAVYLAYATGAGHGVIDREPYLPRGWLADSSAATPPAARTSAALRAGPADLRAALATISRHVDDYAA